MSTAFSVTFRTFYPFPSAALGAALIYAARHVVDGTTHTWPIVRSDYLGRSNGVDAFRCPCGEVFEVPVLGFESAAADDAKRARAEAHRAAGITFHRPELVAEVLA